MSRAKPNPEPKLPEPDPDPDPGEEDPNYPSLDPDELGPDVINPIDPDNGLPASAQSRTSVQVAVSCFRSKTAGSIRRWHSVRNRTL
jgi:hypothetical protein